jgi:hypothetical protein
MKGASESNLPKIKTFNVNVNHLRLNQMSEVLWVKLAKETLVTPFNVFFRTNKNAYVETECFFYNFFENKLIGPFTAINDNFTYRISLKVTIRNLVNMN